MTESMAVEWQESEGHRRWGRPTVVYRTMCKDMLLPPSSTIPNTLNLYINIGI